MKVRYRTPTAREQAHAFARLAHDVRLARCVTMDHNKVVDLLDRLTAYSHAHDDANGERSEADIKRNINEAFWTKIAADMETGRR